MTKRIEKAKKLEKEIQKEENKIKFQKRVKKIIKISIIVLILVFASLYYMRFIETKMLKVKEVKVESTKIKENLSGLKIVHFSDLHYKMSTDDADMKKIVKKINELKADIIVFTGDLLDSNAIYEDKDFEILEKYLKKLNATNKKYYVKGNHDYDFNEVDLILENADFISLNNKDDYIYEKDNEKIYISGLGSKIKEDFHQEESFINQEENVFSITLFHEPDNILDLTNKTIDLALTGHSHNNQINIPGISSLFLVEGAKKYYNSYYYVNNTHLYINQGIGTSMYRLRLFAPPTINLYRLVSKEA